MTKYIYLLMTFLLISCSGNKQKTKFIIPTDNLEDIILNKSVINKDTIYFYFDYSENLEKDRIQIDPIKKDTFMNYKYYESHKNIYNTKRYFCLFYRTHLYHNDQKIANLKVISKQFLKKNKNSIIFPKDLEGNNMYKYVAKEFSGKVYYIIDTSEKKGDKFIAREIRYYFCSFLEI